MKGSTGLTWISGQQGVKDTWSSCNTSLWQNSNNERDEAPLGKIKLQRVGDRWQERKKGITMFIFSCVSTVSGYTQAAWVMEFMLNLHRCTSEWRQRYHWLKVIPEYIRTYAFLAQTWLFRSCISYTVRGPEKGEPLPLRNMSRVTFRGLRNDNNLWAEPLQAVLTLGS